MDGSVAIYPERSVSVADTHCGSLWGLLHPDWWNAKTPKATQQLWECWTYFVHEWLPDKLDACFHLGDIIDGPQRRSASTGIVTADMGEQVEIAIAVHEPLLSKCTKVVRVMGTPYHEGFDGALRFFDEHFGIKTPEPERRVVRNIRLSDRCVANLCHEAGRKGIVYPGQGANAEAKDATLAYADNPQDRPNLLLRAHQHIYQDVRCLEGPRVVNVGCWQLQSDYAQGKGQFKWRPVIGGVLLEANTREALGLTVIPKTFRVAQLERVEDYAEI